MITIIALLVFEMLHLIYPETAGTRTSTGHSTAHNQRLFGSKAGIMSYFAVVKRQLPCGYGIPVYKAVDLLRGHTSARPEER